MSPGATFERVYNELKRMLAEGELPPGTPIEPALIGKQIASSITPIRDALHRLTGERLVEAPNHNGFRVPRPSESDLRDLYQWNARLLALALKNGGGNAASLRRSAVSISGETIAAATATFFLRIAQGTLSGEHIAAVARLNDRLAPFRRIEGALLNDAATELEQIAAAIGNRAQLAKLLASYHRRRMRATPDIMRF
jgi:DNA-binding GntR family transcriptional regulator